MGAYLYRRVFKMQPTMCNKKSFTLTELIVVVLIIGIMAGFAIPNYGRAVERAHRRDAETNLLAIHAANRIYFSEHDNYWPDGGAGALADINQNLRLSIIPNGMTYNCTNVTANDYTCTATRNPPATSFTITITQAQPPNPTCSGTCP